MHLMGAHVILAVLFKCYGVELMITRYIEWSYTLVNETGLLTMMVIVVIDLHYMTLHWTIIHLTSLSFQKKIYNSKWEDK